MTRLVERQTEASMHSLERSVLVCARVRVSVREYIHKDPEMICDLQINTEVLLLQIPDFYALRPTLDTLVYSG